MLAARSFLSEECWECDLLGHWKREPQKENKLEGVVEWEPVNGIDQALKHSQESIDNPVCQPLSIIGLVDAEEGLEGVVAWDDESSNVGEELTANVEKDQEEVGGSETEEGIDLGDGGLLLQVVQDGILGKLYFRYVVSTVFKTIVYVVATSIVETFSSLLWKRGSREIATYFLINLADLSLSLVLERCHFVV